MLDDTESGEKPIVSALSYSRVYSRDTLSLAFKILVRCWYASSTVRAEKALGYSRHNVTGYSEGTRPVTLSVVLRLLSRGDRDLRARIAELEDSKARWCAKVDAKIARAKADHEDGTKVL